MSKAQARRLASYLEREYDVIAFARHAGGVWVVVMMDGGDVTWIESVSDWRSTDLYWAD